MEWIAAAGLGCIAVVYMARFYCLRADVRKTIKEMRELWQNPEDNRILLLSHPEKETEALLQAVNEHTREEREERIYYQNRERKLRARIEDISHDLRTPLTAVIGYLELLEGAELTMEDRSNLERAVKKARSLQGLIGNFYDMSRLEIDDYHLRMEKLDIARFTEETGLLFWQLFEKRGLLVNFAIEESPLYIMADSMAMERIFNNMMQNALRYAESYLRISVCRKGQEICLIFENDTHSLNAGEVSRLFERFYVRENSLTRQSSGLGLAVNKLLTEAMGGTAEARKEGESLKISLRFPELQA